jgi:hypothetical protein
MREVRASLLSLPKRLSIGLLERWYYFRLTAAALIRDRHILESIKHSALSTHQEPFGSADALCHVGFHHKLALVPFGKHTTPAHPHLASHAARFAIAANMLLPYPWPPPTTIHHCPVLPSRRWPIVPLRCPQPVAVAATCADLARKVFVDLHSWRQWTAMMR